MSNIPWDWVSYLFLTQCILILAIIIQNEEKASPTSYHYKLTTKHLLYLQIFLVASIWLIFGGYTTDAPRYLTRFERDPFGFSEEQLFWLFGHSLSQIMPDPWPMKVLSFACSVLLSFAIIINSGSKKTEEKIFLIWVVVLLPTTFFLAGNVVRQGYSIALVLFATYYFRQGKYLLTLLFTIGGFLFHRYSVLFVLGVACARFIPNRNLIMFPIVLIAAFSAEYVQQLLDIDLTVMFPYMDETNGHYLKVILFLLCTVIFLIVKKYVNNISENEKFFIDCYIYLLTFALFYLKHETLFERISLFAAAVVPLCIPILIRANFLQSKYSIATILSINLLAIGFWAHPSILNMLGFI